MNAFVIDTNVLIVPDTESKTHPECAQACDQALKTAQEGIVVLDSKYQIIKEYKQVIDRIEHKGKEYQKLSSAQAFLTWIHKNLKVTERVEMVDCNNIEFEENTVFTDGLGLEKFDRSDRKFVVVALNSNSNPKIIVSIERGWLKHLEALKHLNLNIDLICPGLNEKIARNKKR